MDLVIEKSNKGNDKLFVDGYGYHFHSKNKKDEYRWSCSQRKVLLCKSVVITNKVDERHHIKKSPSCHNHDPIAHVLPVTKSNNNLKKMGSSSALQPSQIIRETVVSCQPDCRVYLPSKRAQKLKISRIRKTNETMNEPQSLSEINIPEYLKYLEGDLFVLKESDFNGAKNIIMGSSVSLKALGSTQCWVMDGTFYVVPTIFRQLFTIQGLIEGQFVPLIFCLMSKKSTEAYSEFFYELFHLAAERNINLNPSRIITDFEKTISSAAKQYFPDAPYKGCLFHFGQIVWRRVQREGLAQKYGNHEKFNIHVRMLKSLSFVPPENVLNYYNELNTTYEDNDLKKISIWFKQNYINGRNQSNGPKYKPEFWCVVDSIRENFPRTQNSIEAWHRRLKVVVGKKSCGLYAIIKELAKEMIVVKTNLEKIQSGEGIAPKKSSAERYRKIKKVIKNRKRMGKIEYLKSIAYNISLCN